MNIQVDQNLINTIIRADTSKTRLEGLLFAIRDTLFAETANSTNIWVTLHSDDNSENALAYLEKDSIKWQSKSDSNDDKSVKERDLRENAAYTIEIGILSDSETKIAGYLHFSNPPLIAEDWWQVINALLYRELMDLNRKRTKERLDSIIDNLWDQEDIFHTFEPLKQDYVNKLGADISTAFRNQSLCVLVYGLRDWRNPEGEPMIYFGRNHQLSENTKDNFYQLFKKDIYQCLIQNKLGNQEDKTGGKIQPSEKLEGYDDREFYLAAKPILYPKKSDDVAGIPFIGVVFIQSPDDRLDEYELNSLHRFLIELKRILRLREEFKLMNGMSELIQDFPSFTSPDTVAHSVAKYLDESFSASEVAILERRGMFLSIIAKDEDVKLKDVPPLHLLTTQALVCDVAKSRVPSYIEDVTKEEAYLPVVPLTKTQFTVPLIWQEDLVGVLLVGLSVFDGFEPRHQKIIQILAGFCAAAITVSRRTADEKTIRYMLSDALTSAALKINSVIEFNQDSSSNKSPELQPTYNLLCKYQQFIDKLHKAQTSVEQETPFDLRDIVNKIEKSPLLTLWLQEHPKHSVSITPFNKPLFANVDNEGLLTALSYIVLNALEVIEEEVGKAKISMSIKEVKYKAESKAIPFGVIRITDEGKGIPLPEQVKIFDLFFSAKSNRLYIAKSFIERFGGRLELSSSIPDKGSEFSLWIPIKQE